MKKLYHDAQTIINRVIQANMPQKAVREAIKNHCFTGNIFLLAAGKAAWTMAKCAKEELGGRIARGIVITKYGHALGDIQGMEIIEAGHPLPDENSVKGAEKAIEMAEGLSGADELLFLVSGGGSALFEKPLEGLTLRDITEINSRLLACGADIVEINMIRKRLSAVKAGRYAQICSPAKIFTIALSDVLGGRLDSIASGPAVPDMSTAEEAVNVLKKYKIDAGDKIIEYLQKETPKKLDNVETVITGSVRRLCGSAAVIASEAGYTPHILCTEMNCEAREAGRLAAAVAKEIAAGGNRADDNTRSFYFRRPCAVILGGETVVTLKGNGKGGRNQEIALAAAEGIAGLDNILVFSLSSDGTDGPTDAAGGIVDGFTYQKLKEKGLNLRAMLDNNDSYNALAAADGLIKTGPTGTNVNDITIILASSAEQPSDCRK